MKSIAIIFNGNLSDRKGYVNAVLERTKRLSRHEEYRIDVYCIGEYDHWLTRQLRNSVKSDRQDIVVIDGMKIRMLWIPFSLIDYFLSVKLNIYKVIEPFFLNRYISIFKNYDLICAHSAVPGNFAMKINNRYNVSYVVTWHGSDIHTDPFINQNYQKMVIKIMRHASANLFVSKNLLETAYIFNPEIPNAKISYNGSADEFRKLPKNERHLLRQKYGIETTDKVVGFVGGLTPIKNADKLPELFYYISHCGKPIKFWVIGDGKLRNLIESKLKDEYPNLDYRLFGNQPPEKMSDLMSCLDLLVLPSKNEGLPLVIVEALSCAINVVASNVGGIREVVGEQNVINHGDGFVERFGDRCIDILVNEERTSELPKQFNWNLIVDKELMLYKSILEYK